VCILFHAEFDLLTACGSLSLSTTSLCLLQPHTHQLTCPSRAPHLVPVLLVATSRASFLLHAPPHHALVTTRVVSPCTHALLSLPAHNGWVVESPCGRCRQYRGRSGPQCMQWACRLATSLERATMAVCTHCVPRELADSILQQGNHLHAGWLRWLTGRSGSYDSGRQTAPGGKPSRRPDSIVDTYAHPPSAMQAGRTFLVDELIGTVESA
jgi:hypothetical protein